MKKKWNQIKRTILVKGNEKTEKKYKLKKSEKIK